MRVFLSFVVLSLVSTAICATETTTETLSNTDSRTYFTYRPSGPGGSCGGGRSCARGLVCESHVCKIKAGRSCSRYRSFCAGGTSCARSGGKQICVEILGRGDGCDPHDLTSICRSGLVCRASVCSAPEIPEGGRCRSFGTRCAAGLVCRRRRCRKPVVQFGGDCSGDGAVCRRGSECISKGFTQLCLIRVGFGGSCRSSFAFCDSGLSCKRGRCSKPRSGLGGRCGGAIRCDRGLKCKRTSFFRSGRCVGFARNGESCGTFVLCQFGTKCFRGKCHRPKKYYHH